MQRFLIEVAHPAERAACLRAVRDVLETGSHFVTHAEWGCYDGVHTGWIIVEAENRDEARLVLPPRIRLEARVVGLNRFRLEELDDLERQHPG